MSSAVGIVGTTQGASTAPVASASAPSLSAASGLSSSASSSAVSGSLQNPRVLLDPSAGFITEYLSANGSEVIAQSPSAITVAYLRLGLTADGLSKQNAQTLPPHVSATV